MAFHINAEKISLVDLQKRIEATDLVPSREPLRENIASRMKALEKLGIVTLADLRNELKTAKRLTAVAKVTEIDEHYLVLLRREIEGYFPKPVALKTIPWLPKEEIAKLERSGIVDTAMLYEATHITQKQAELAKSTGVALATLATLSRLADLMRVQWVSPTFARMLFEADYDSAARVASANADELCEALEHINAGDRYFKGKISLRDIKRLIQSASYV